jgi:hypothetical protein
MFPNIQTQRKKCFFVRNNLPSFTPIIYGLSQSSSNASIFTEIFITGENFFRNGTTYVNFGAIKNIPVTYYSSFNISFIVPTNATPGNYNVTATNIFNGNFSLPVQWTYPPNLNNSNSINYTIL